MTYLKRVLFLLVPLTMAYAPSAWASDPIYTSFFGNTAVQGYDAVSYFQGDGVPQEGDEAFAMEWRGAEWRFVSQENLDLFRADPEKYAPQYGGYCAWAMADGKLAKGDALIYDIVDGKLYLNFSAGIQDRWTPTKDEFISQADAQYPNVVDLN